MYQLKPSTVAHLFHIHEQYWQGQRAEMGRLKDLYEHNYWKRTVNEYHKLVETSDAYGYIEGFRASLFSRNPAVMVSSGIRPTGEPKVAEAVANDFLLRTRTQLEDASVLALIYPSSFLKLIAEDTDDVEAMVTCMPLAPWEVLVDREAVHWDSQRFLGHVYWLPLLAANDTWGDKYYDASTKEDFWDETVSEADKKEMPDDDFFKYIQVLELYDLQNDKLYFWSPNYAGGLEWLDEEDSIPFRTVDDRPLVTIAPIYYSRIPDSPLDGYSALSRVYDQCAEKNQARTAQANGVRKYGRQWLYKKGLLDDVGVAAMESGADGSLVPVDTTEDLRSSIMHVPHNPTPPELENYIQQVQTDLNKGSLMNPNTRGEATKATATEIQSLQHYTSTEIGRLARERDALIESVSNIYVGMLRILLPEDGLLLNLSGKTQRVTADALDGDFRFYTLEAGSNPVTKAAKKSEFMELLPLLLQPGMPKEVIDELASLFDLSDALVESLKAKAGAEASAMEAASAGPQEDPGAMGAM